MWFITFVNPDGANFINDYYDENNVTTIFFKNRNFDSKSYEECGEFIFTLFEELKLIRFGSGVNLKLNFEANWGVESEMNSN